MRDARLALLVLLVLGLGVSAGLLEAQRDGVRRAGARHRSKTDARLITPVFEAEALKDEEPGSSRPFAPRRADEEAGGATMGDGTPADPAPLPNLDTWQGSRTLLKAWIRQEIAKLTGAAPRTPEGIRLARLGELLKRILKERTADPGAPLGWPWPLPRLRPFPSRPWRGGELDEALPAGSGVW